MYNFVHSYFPFFVHSYSIIYKYVKHIHLRDYKDNYDYILEGNLEIDKLLNKLIEEEYDGLISIESHLPMIKDDNKVEMFNRSIENIRKWLKEVI